MNSDSRSSAPFWRYGVAAILALILVGSLYGSYRERQRRESALGAMVVAFQEQNQLSVFKAQVPSFVNSRKEGWIFDSEQTGVIPASVEYRLDLSKITERNFEWDEDAQKMIVTIPPLIVDEPVLDMQRAKLVNRGILMTGNTAVELIQKNAAVAKRQALAEAKNPQLMRLAEDAARKAMTQNVSIPLQVAGFDDTAVTVRFADEPAARDPSYIDQSISYNEAVEEARRRRAGQGSQ